MIADRLTWQFLQLRLVIEVGQIVMRGQPYHSPSLWRELGEAPTIQLLQRLCRGMTIPHFIQNLDERLVLLTIDVTELNGDIVYLLQRFRPEEIGRVVVLLQQLLLIGSDDRRQLLQVAYHQQLHTAKRQRVVAEAAQHIVDGIEQVGSHHRYLVDNQQVDGGNNLSFLAPEVEPALHLGTRHVWREGQLEE